MEFLEKLVKTFGPSGNEAAVGNLIVDEITPYVDEIKRDRLGNVIALKKGTSGKKIMAAAHMDQIGIMVTAIDKNGFLRFTNIGYIDPYVALSQRIVFSSGIYGAIWREEKKDIKNLKLSDLYIDIGVQSREEAEKSIRIGEFGVFHSDFRVQGTKISSGALDDRLGCYVLIETLKKLNNPENDVYFVFTVQEETFISGAMTSSYAIEPESAIVVDVTSTGDTPECRTMEVKLGEGCTIKVMDRGLICHPDIKKYLAKISEENGIKYQYEVLEGGATDGFKIHTVRSGVKTGVVSIPTRYVHSTQEMVDVRDVENAIKLMTLALKNYK